MGREVDRFRVCALPQVRTNDLITSFLLPFTLIFVPGYQGTGRYRCPSELHTSPEPLDVSGNVFYLRILFTHSSVWCPRQDIPPLEPNDRETGSGRVGVHSFYDRDQQGVVLSILVLYLRVSV